MLRRRGSRFASALLVVLGVSLLVSALIRLVPGDPVEAMLGETATRADRAELRRALGLDQPIVTQWARFLGGAARLDFGHSLQGQQPVAASLASRLPSTALLAGAALMVAIGIALPLGAFAALRAGTAWDAAASVLAVLGMSVPSFLLGPVLIVVFALWLGWLPVGGSADPGALVLPAVTLGLALAAILTRMVRAALLETLNEDYIRAARARGLGAYAVLWRHALPNAALPVLTVLGMQLGVLLGGAVITEMVFGWPGIGALTVEAIQRRDYPVVQACIFVISIGYVAANTLTDLLCAAVDPRIGADT